MRRMLTDADREEISRGNAEGRVIAERIGRDPSVVSPDVARHGGRARYRATVAGRAAAAARCRPTIRKLNFGDEAGMRTDHHAGTTWAPVGQTPVVEVTGERAGVNMISAVSPRGTLHFTVFSGRFNAAVFVEFLTKLMHDAPGPVYLILDNLSVHKAKIVKDYVDSLEGRLKLFFLPGYSPELNPDEWVWKNVKNNQVGRHRHRTEVRTIRSRHTRPGTPATIARDCSRLLPRPIVGLHRNMTRVH